MKFRSHDFRLSSNVTACFLCQPVLEPRKGHQEPDKTYRNTRIDRLKRRFGDDGNNPTTSIEQMGFLGLIGLGISLLPSLLYYILITLPLRWLADICRSSKEKQRRASRARRKSVSENKDMYGLKHRILNYEDPLHDSLWLNMGYWKEAHTFIGACEDLADLAARAAHVRPQSRIFEAGSACGDSSFHLLTAFRADHVFAVTLEPVQHYAALNRARQLKLDRGVTFLFGDAVEPNDWTPTPIHAWENTFDSAVSIDAAYHFRTREAFLKLCLERVLKPGGHVGLADIVAGPGFPEYFHSERPMAKAVFEKVFEAVQFPLENLWHGVDEYTAKLEELGYVDVSVKDISDDVFPGFVQFLDRFQRTLRPSGFEERAEVFYFAFIREIIRWMAERKILRFVIASGRKP